jgi:hypothetical protein
LVGDVNYTNDKLIFTRDLNDQKKTGDIGGAAWYTINRNQLSGVKVSFTPFIVKDRNYYGNVKYPYGFAIVFTSNDPTGVIGNKRSGLGYDGIFDAVAIEFDFVENRDRSDIKNPHLSVHYNLDGPISATTPSDCGHLCNVTLPNFYDTDKGPLVPGPITIEVYNKKIWVKKGTEVILAEAYFPQLEEMMERNTVYFGITASMNQYKSVEIRELEFFRSKYLF